MMSPREPDWRWLRAAALAADGRPIPGHYDARTRQAVRFARALHGCADDAARAKLTRRRPALAAAHALYAAEPSWPRWELEAWLLTDEPIEQIAVRMEMHDDVVATYHDLFFDVRGRLQAKDWVAHHVPGGEAHRRPDRCDPGVLLKLYGYHFGAVVLESLLAYFRAPPAPLVDPGSLDADARAGLRGKLRIRAAIVTQLQPVDGPSAGRLLGVLDRVGKKLRQAEEAAATARMLEAGLRGGGADAPALGTPTKSDEKDDAAA
jgi:hypothetical protein